MKSSRDNTDLSFGKMPKGEIPAAWWYTSDEETVAAHDRWREDYERVRGELFAFAETLGVTPDRVYVWTGGATTSLTGFIPSADQHRDPPPGWRYDRKSDRLVPIRKTKADRQSEANKQFSRFARIPNALTYVKGMPADCFIPAGGGSCYFMSPRIWRSGDYVCAWLAGDPDRCEQPWPVDADIWTRGTLEHYRVLRDADQAVQG